MKLCMPPAIYKFKLQKYYYFDSKDLYDALKVNLQDSLLVVHLEVDFGGVVEILGVEIMT